MCMWTCAKDGIRMFALNAAFAQCSSLHDGSSYKFAIFASEQAIHVFHGRKRSKKWNTTRFEPASPCLCSDKVSCPGKSLEEATPCW